MSARQTIYALLKPTDEHHHQGRWFDWFLIVLIVANVIAVMLETLPDFSQQYAAQLYWFEVISVGLFTAEYLARIWTCTEELDAGATTPLKHRVSFIFRPMSLIDLLAILPFYLSMFMAIDLRVLRLFRFIRLFKLGRYSSAMQTLQLVIAKEYRTIIAALGMLMIVMIIAATVMYFLEREAQPEAFGNIPQALWWSLVTLSTVGYGDVTPVTPAGQIFSGVFIMMGVALFALPAGILASSFTEQVSLRRDNFRTEILDLLNDGHLTLADLDRLEHIRQTIGLDKEEAGALFRLAKQQIESQMKPVDSTCPHCGKTIHSPHDRKS